MRECIDEAIILAEETETIEAERDEATLGTTGSPDIVSTLFSKIDDCDLFIADVSLCFSEDHAHEKRSPNPNVLLELGYAAKTLGWNRVVCFCNTDFGDNYPFDIAHNRITNFSFEGKSRAEVKNDLAKIIFINIRDIRKLPPRAKSGVATHIIGSYDVENHDVINILKPVTIGLQEGYLLHNNELLRQSEQLFTEIQNITLDCNATSSDDEKSIEIGDASTVLPQYELSRNKTAIHLLAESYKGQEIPVVWKDADADKERISRLLHADTSENFFDLGGLKKNTPLLGFQEATLCGTENEKNKYEKLEALSYKLLTLDIRTAYLKTFAGMLYIPLAIKNISAVQDTDIRVVVTVESGEIVEPDRNLIYEEYDGLQGCLCRDDDDQSDIGIIGELFGMYEDGVIHIEEAPWDASNSMPKTPILTATGWTYPGKTEEDYEQELKEYIATSKGTKYYEFEILGLRPGECKWMNSGMLVKPVDNTVTINYRIQSSHSTGNLEGNLSISLE